MSRVLVVDDDPDIRELCRVVLTSEGYQVIEAEDVRSGLAVARRERPDLVLLDWMMPGTDGMEALRTLKAERATRAIPVVMLTALDGLPEITVATYNGADGYVTKPFEMDALLALVRRYTTSPAGAEPDAGTRSTGPAPAPELADRIRKLRPYIPGKPIEEVEREYGLTDVVKLASNENPLGPSPRALTAISEAAQSLAFYPDGSCHLLIQALARHWSMPPENLVAGNGSDEIIHYLGLAFLQPGDEVLTGDPSFVRYEAAAVLNDAAYVAVPLREHHFDLEAMAERLSPRTRLVFIANPNNPTGTMVGAPALERFLDRCPDRAIVVLDEAYYEYVDAPDYPSSEEYLRQGRNVVILRTFSKIYALAGLRVGYGMARPEIIRAIHQVREPFNVNSLAQAAARASLEDVEHVERSRRLNAEGRDYLSRELERLGLSSVPSQANFILVDVRQPCAGVYEKLLRRGVIVRRGDQLSPALPTYLRVSVGTPADNERFIRELAAALD